MVFVRTRSVLWIMGACLVAMALRQVARTRWLFGYLGF